ILPRRQEGSPTDQSDPVPSCLPISACWMAYDHPCEVTPPAGVCWTFHLNILRWRLLPSNPEGAL
ncbi:unnamed protein product, partial [Nesidiocoris tenuis]